MKSFIFLFFTLSTALATAQNSSTIFRRPIDGSVYSGRQCRIDTQQCPGVGQTYCEYVSCSGPVWSPSCEITDKYCRSTLQPVK